MSEAAVDLKKTFADLFNKVAVDFDTFGPRSFTYFGERLVGHMGLSEGASVLDVASGKGASLFPAAAGVGPSGRVTGIDIAEEMVNLTLARVKDLDLKHVDVMHMDAESLTFPDETYDDVICGFGLFFLPDHRAALKEIMRVLKPGGKFGFTTFQRSEDEDFKWVRELADKYFPRKGESKAAYQLTGPVFDTVDGLTGILSEAGFSDIDIFSEEKEFILKDEDEWWNRLWSQGSRLQLEKLSPEILGRYRAEAFERLGEIKRDDGIHLKLSVLFAFGTKPEGEEDEYAFSNDKSLMSIDRVCHLLTQTYWANTRARDVIELSIKNSLCYGVFHKGIQVGFARAVTDFATVFWLCDVIIDEGHRGKGLGKRLVDYIVNSEELKDVRGILRTRDAHGLYKRFGFVNDGDHFMFRHK